MALTMFNNSHLISPERALLFGNHLHKCYQIKLENVVRKRTRKQPSVIAQLLFENCLLKKIEKKKLKWLTGDYFGFFSVKFVMGYPCARHNILF